MVYDTAEIEMIGVLNHMHHRVSKNYMADIMYLLSAADLMAVNDTLLTNHKLIETREAYSFFCAVIKNGLQERNKIMYGIQRFRSLLEDSMKLHLEQKIALIIEIH